MSNDIKITLTSEEWKATEALGKPAGKDVYEMVGLLFRKGLQDALDEIARFSNLEKRPKNKGNLQDAQEAVRKMYAKDKENCRHEKTETFEDGAMYRCLSCGATGITGSGNEPTGGKYVAREDSIYREHP